jgi:hypothetical protein
MEKQKLGRKVKPMKQYVENALQHQWAHLNPQHEGLKVSSNSKWVFALHCKDGQQHFGYMTVEAVDTNESSLDCYRCFPRMAGRPSRFEQEAYQAIEVAIEAQVPIAEKFGLWVCESRVIPGKPKSPVDIFFVQHRLVCQIDGEPHFKGKMHGTPSKLFQQRDKEFDAAAWDAEFRLLRMHFEDMANFEDYLFDAIQRCIQHPNKPFIMYSNKWPECNRHPACQLTV